METARDKAKAQPATWVRSGVMAGAPELVGALGGNFRELARRAGISAYAAQNPDAPMPASAFVALLELAASELDCEAFGLRLGCKQDLSLFGALFPLFSSAPTIGDFIADLAAYFPIHTQGAIVGLEKSSDGLLVTYELSAGVAKSQRQVLELGFSVLASEFRRHRLAWRPQEVYFRHGPPRDLQWHRAIFGSGLSFNADRNAIFVEQEMLDAPTRTADAEAHGRLAERVGSAGDRIDGMIRIRTEGVVRALLPFVACDIATAARLLRLSPRTLQRRLAESGSAFSEIVDAVRADLAYAYLIESDLSVAEVAEILQFAETSALSRAFRRWHNMSPRRAKAIGKESGARL